MPLDGVAPLDGPYGGLTGMPLAGMPYAGLTGLSGPTGGAGLPLTGAELTGWAPIGLPLTGYVGLGLTGAWGIGGADTWAVARAGALACWADCCARVSSAVQRLPSPTTSSGCSMAVGAMPS